MGQQYSELSAKHIEFIEAQKIFFVGTATAESRVNVSPKGMNAFKVLSNRRVAWLNLTGSGNETAAHVQQSPRMTIMFCAFDGSPMILRLYGAARAIHKGDPDWQKFLGLFEPIPGARQIFDVEIELVQASCGMAVPCFTYTGERDALVNWAVNKGEEGLERYREERNQFSIDGIPTHIVEKGG